MILSTSLLLATLSLTRLVAGSASPQIAQYWPAYSTDVQTPAQISSWSSTSVMYYFVTVTTATGMELPEGQSEEDIKSFIQLSKDNNVKPVFTVGGWTGSMYFSKLAASSESRTGLSNQLREFAEKYGFEGVDVDWEYPNAEGAGCNSPTKADSAHFLLFLKELRSVFGKDKLLTSAVSMTGFIGEDGQPLKDASEFASYLDYIQIMAYDVSGSWSDTSGPLAPLRACSSGVGVDTAVDYWTGAGFPASQILLGLPAYSTSFTLTSSQLTNSTTAVGGYSSQLYNAKTSTTPQGNPQTDSMSVAGVDQCGNKSPGGGYSGQWQMKDLISAGLLSKDEQSGGKGYARYWDECSSTPFLFNSENKVLISYDDSGSVKAKSEFAKEKGLGGVMIFDTQGYTDEVYKTMTEALGFKSSAGSSSGDDETTGPVQTRSSSDSDEDDGDEVCDDDDEEDAPVSSTQAAAVASQSASPSPKAAAATPTTPPSSSPPTDAAPGVVKLSPSASPSPSSSPPSDSSTSGGASIQCTSSSTWSLCSGQDCTPMGQVAEGTMCVDGEIVGMRKRERRAGGGGRKHALRAARRH